MLQKKLHHDVKMVRDVSEWSKILKEYEKAQNDLVRAGALVQLGWGEVVTSLSNS